jgi:hypothetical protein
MGFHDSFGHLKHKLWPKKRSGVKLSVWLPTIKSWESTWFSSVQAACNIPLKSFWQGLQLSFRPHCNQRSACEVMRPQSYKSPNCGKLGSPGTKCHLDMAHVESWRKYYKGEGGGFPQVRAVVSFVSLRLPMVHLNTKSAQTMH